MTLPTFLRVAPTPTDASRLTHRVKALARECGLTVAAVTGADPFDGLADHLCAQIDKGHLAGLDWFTPERATFSADPRNLQPTARSLLSVGVAYWSVGPDKPDDGVPRGRIARYAWGVDYHKLLKRRMASLLAAIEREVGRPVEARLLVDTARIVDRAVAARSGLGWYGKHSCIIVPGHGSWVMLGEIALDLELEPDRPLDRHCGSCSICIDLCPTGAIVAPGTIDTPRCLSFQTIEQRGAIPVALRSSLGDWVFGCDVCQEVCPYTKAASPGVDPEFLPGSVDRAYPSLRWLLSMTETEFRACYGGSAVTRAKRRGLARNAAIALGNVGSSNDVPYLAIAMAEHDEPLVRGHAAWSLGKLGGGTARRALLAAAAREQDTDARIEITAALERL